MLQRVTTSAPRLAAAFACVAMLSLAAVAGARATSEASAALRAEAAAATAAPASAAPDAGGAALPDTLPAQERLPLGAGSAPLLGDDARAAQERGASTGGWVLRTAGALGLVVCLMLGLRWAMKKASGVSGSLRAQLGAGGKAPSGVLFVMGRYPVSRGQSLVLVRLDRRVLLLSQSSEGFRTLTEVTGADEVASLIRQTERDSGTSATAKFASLLKSLERDPSVTSDVTDTGPTELNAGELEPPHDSMTNGRVIIESKSPAPRRRHSGTDVEA